MIRKELKRLYNRRCLRAGRLLTSTAGAVTPLIVMLALAGIVSIGISNGNTYATDSISLSIDTNTISLDLAPRTATGEFKESSSANISASTTNSTGYTLSIASSTNSTDLTNTTDHTSKITSIESNLTTSDFSNASNTQYNNKWGYKPSQYVTTSGDTHTTHTNTGANAVFKPLPGQAGEILAITEQANQQNSPDTYTISMGARVNNTIPTGSYQSNAFVIMAVANKSTIDCDDTKLCVQFDSNGLTFPETEAQTERVVNNVNYNSVTTQQPMTKYSHTPNISDAGVQNGNYANSYTQNEVVTIDGASTLHIKLTYGGESASWDWVSFWAGDYPSYTAASNYSTGIQNCGGGTVTNGKYGGTNGTTVECDITGPSVTFAFISDGSGVGNGYGYYAVVTGTSIVRDRTLTSGEYAIPTNTNPYRFHGWSEDPSAISATSATYTDEAAVKTKLPGDNGETKTLYAVYDRGLTIKYSPTSNSGSGTGTMNDQTIYTNDPQSLTTNGFTAPNVMAFKEWNTTPDGSGTVYHDGEIYTPASTTSIGDTITLYAIWKQGYNVTFTKDSNVASIEVLDSNGTLVSTITNSGQSLILYQGDTYTLKPTYATGYTTNSITKTTGAGTITQKLPNADFTVGTGTATVNIASRTLITFDQAFASAGKTKYNGYYKIQDANSTICSNVDLARLGAIGEVIDVRDNQVYKIGKLDDGKCWMVENLNLAGGTALDADKTDVTSAYISSFTTSNNLTKDGNTIVLPTSSTSGFNNNNYSYVYNSGNKTNCGASGQNTPCYSYYSWDAATLGSGRSIGTDNTDAEQSICPKGWKLPTVRGTSASNWQTTSDFYAMAHQYGLNSTTSTSESDADFYNQAGPGTTPNFLLAGSYVFGSFSSGGSSGQYWSSTSFFSTDYARFFGFHSSDVDSASGYYRTLGLSVRCLLR